jgi:aldehyde:ferredoxin oxidoreductase
MPAGFFGRLLEVDCSGRTTCERALEARLFERFLGGSGLATRLLWDELEPGRRPLDSASPLIFANGLLAGVPVPAACKLSICGISPLTGIWNEAAVGGDWAARFRRTGYDAIHIRGASTTPCYLLVQGREASLLDASELWGLDSFDTHERLRLRHGPRAAIACIGPAGERGVLLAGIMVDGRSARAAGRGGMGALMGSKGLKAVVVLGDEPVELADADGLKVRVRQDMKTIRARSQALQDFGTAGGIQGADAVGALPVKNWAGGAWAEGALATTAQTFFPRYLDKHHACWGCPMRCSKHVRVVAGPHAGIHGHAPEYETLAGFGANCLNSDVEVIMAANDACNRAGLDTISTSSAVAFAMEAAERGMIGPDDAEGLSLAWGDARTILGLVEQIAAGRSLGALLGQGTRAAAAMLGPEAMAFAPHSKGLELPYHDPRALHSMALSYATSNRGACHLSSMSYHVDRGIPMPELGYDGPPSMMDSTGKARVALDMQDFITLFNPLGLCKFLIKTQVGPSQLCAWVRAVTGWELAPAELLLIGERIFLLQRLINLRLGMTRADDTLPARFLEQARPDGAAAGSLPELERMLTEYYALRGWDEQGRPTPEALERVGLGSS